MKKIIKKQHTPLPFDQPSDFFYRRALKSLDKYEYEKAVYNIKKALRKDEKNLTYNLELAGMLSEIEHFDASNDLLFNILQDSREEISECYFGIGCNFFGLNDYQKASASLLKYIKLSPDGEFVEDAEIMLEGIDYDLHLEEDEKDSTLVWKNALHNGDSKNAIKILSNLSDVSMHEHIIIRNNLTVAYLLEAEVEKAMSCCREVLQLDPNNLHALCNMSLIHIRLKNHDEAKVCIAKAIDIGNHDISELLKISVALCELDMHKKAISVFKTILEENLYDLHSQHYIAIAYFNLGNYKKSLESFNFISMFKPDCSINNWYLRLLNEKITGKVSIDYLHYTNQVSSANIYSRFRRINDIIEDKAISCPWDHEEFRELVIWALDIKDENLKSSMISLITKYAGPEAYKILRSNLCSRHVSDNMKHKILINLKKANAEEPYLAILDNSIVEVNVNTFEINSDKYNEYQKIIIDQVLQNIEKEYDNDFVEFIMDLWNKILANDKIFDIMIDGNTWAAVLEYAYVLSKNIDFELQKIADKYHIDMDLILSLTNKINKE